MEEYIDIIIIVMAIGMILLLGMVGFLISKVDNIEIIMAQVEPVLNIEVQEARKQREAERAQAEYEREEERKLQKQANEIAKGFK